MAFLQDWIIPFLVDYGLLAIFITMTLESACVPIPSEIVVPYGGVLAAQGHVTLWAVVVVATVANLVGSSIAYAAGRYGGRALVVRYGRYVFMSPHHLDVADRWFERRGEVTVLVARMMPGVRTFISVPAGVARMPYLRFIVYSALGAFLWNLGLASLGYVFGANWDHLQEAFHRWNRLFYMALAVAVIVAVAWKWRDLRRKRARRADRPG